MKGLEGKNHRLFLDNYFTSYPLLVELKNKEVYVYGTINTTRKYIQQMRSNKMMKQGDVDDCWRNFNV